MRLYCLTDINKIKYDERYFLRLLWNDEDSTVLCLITVPTLHPLFAPKKKMHYEGHTKYMQDKSTAHSTNARLSGAIIVLKNLS